MVFLYPATLTNYVAGRVHGNQPNSKFLHLLFLLQQSSTTLSLQLFFMVAEHRYMLSTVRYLKMLTHESFGRLQAFYLYDSKGMSISSRGTLKVRSWYARDMRFGLVWWRYFCTQCARIRPFCVSAHARYCTWLFFFTPYTVR